MPLNLPQALGFDFPFICFARKRKISHCGHTRVGLRAGRQETAPRDLALVLAAPLTGFPDLQKKVAELLRPMDEQMRQRRADEPEFVALEGFFDCCHPPALGPRSFITVGQIAERVNELLRSRGESLQFNDRRVGSLLDIFEFPKRRSSHGYDIDLTANVLQRVHQLTVQYDLHPRLNPRMLFCPLCNKVDRTPSDTPGLSRA